MTTPRCPICRDPVVSRQAFPFCSERCRLIDLGRWLNEEYRIPDESDAKDEKDEKDADNDECASRS